MNRKYSASAMILLICLLNPMSLNWLESNMAGYMLIQIPGLVAIGFLIGKALPERLPAAISGYNSGGVTGLLVAVFIIAYWILPRSVDAAINVTAVDIWKWFTLPLLAGIPLAWSWRRLSFLAKGFVWANVISMLFVMSWLYTSAPVRLCNNFLVQQQDMLGKAMFLVGLMAAVYFVLQAFIGNSDQAGRSANA